VKLCTVCCVVTSRAGSRCLEHARQSNRSSCRPSVATRLTLVTVDCASFDIAMSVAETDVRVYSPTVLRLGSQPGHMAPIRRD